MDLEQRLMELQAIEQNQDKQAEQKSLEAELDSFQIAQQEDIFPLLNLGSADAEIVDNPEIIREVILSEQVGTVTRINLPNDGLALVNSVARDLSIFAPASKPTESVAVDLMFRFESAPASLNLPPIIINALPDIKAIDNQYYIKKIGSKTIHEISNSVNFDASPEGTIFDTNNGLLSNTSIDVINFGVGPNVATLIDSNNTQGGEQNLQSPWHRGNIQNEDSGHILIIAANNIDQNQDNLIDVPLPENANPGGKITLNFDMPAYEFGWDIFNLEYGPEVQYSDVIFYDQHGRNTTVPFESFIDPQSPFYDPSINLGSHSANRINPVKVEDLALSEIVKVEMILADGVAVSHFNWIEQQIELKPNQIRANILDNDELHGQSVNIENIRFSFGSEQEATQYILDNSNLGTTIHGNEVWIDQLNQTIVTPMGGTLSIKGNGDFLYTASESYISGPQEERFGYEIKAANGITSTAEVVINLQDNIPLANDLDNFAETHNAAHSYNLMLILDVSGSMGADVYSHTRLEMAQDALVQLIDKYDLISDNLNITIVPFASGEGLDGAFGYHATGVEDAKDFILCENTHQSDGIKIQMINPETGDALERSTYYDTALYHARQNLEQDIINPNLADYQHAVYFISDGVANTGHSALDQTNWPNEWGSWQDFIQDTQSEVPDALTHNIEVFAVGIDPDESLKQPLEPIVSKPENIIEPDAKLFTFSQQLLDTLPEVLSGNVLVNDLYWSDNGIVQDVSFEIADAQSFIMANHLSNIAVATNNNHTVQFALPHDGSIITIPTPMEGKLMIDNGGNYQYIGSTVNVSSSEIFTYTLFDTITETSQKADLTIHLYSDNTELVKLVGDHNNNILSTELLDGVVYMESGRGIDSFVIDFTNLSVSTIYMRDLIGAQENQLQFKNVFDSNFDNIINIQDVFMSFEQSQENANVIVQLNNMNEANNFAGTELIFENIGTVPGSQISDLILHLENITSALELV